MPLLLLGACGGPAVLPDGGSDAGPVADGTETQAGEDSGKADAPTGDGLGCRRIPAGATEEVAVFSGARLNFKETTWDITRTLELPCGEAAKLEAILSLGTDCKASCNYMTNPACDPIDRRFSVFADVDGGRLELIGGGTPYGGGRDYDAVDVTPYATALAGSRTLHFHATSYVGTWIVDLKLRYRGGDPPRPVAGIVPLVDRVTWDKPYKKADGDLAAEVAAPPGAAAASLVLISTGHAAGGVGCDEFCMKENQITIDGKLPPLAYTPWRTDCGTFAKYSACPGNYPASRAGWCPASASIAKVLDADGLGAAGKHSVRFSIPGMKADATWVVSLAVVFWR